MAENSNDTNLYITHESDAVLFWLEQEPIESTADIYLPADTPIHRPSSKILYQINKKQELKKARTIERLKAHHYQGVAEARRRFAKEVRKSKLPSKKYEDYLESIKTADFLSDHIPELCDLIQKINSLHDGDSSVKLLDDIAKEQEAYNHIQQEKLKKIENEENRGEDVNLDLFMEELNNYRTQYNRMVSLIQQKKENEQPRQKQSSQQQ